MNAVNDREPRRTTELTGFAVLESGATIEITVLDLSYDGCKIVTPAALLPGLKLKLSILGVHGALDAAVRWSRNGFAGLRFNPDDEPEAGPVQTPREFERVKLDATIALRRPGRQVYAVRLFDLAPSGCKVEFVERPKEGETLWVKFDSLEAIEATVRWVDGFYGGVQFTRPIYSAVFQMLVTRLTKS
ncbi:PilZ domain-containing protein [Sphingomonas xanthus]|nr:PilZ domain-containing protein [Sphingomonas xanthus]